MNLKKKRKEKGITQQELAEKIDAKRTRITNYEIGIREPNIATLKKLASALECTVDELLEDDEQR